MPELILLLVVAAGCDALQGAGGGERSGSGNWRAAIEGEGERRAGPGEREASEREDKAGETDERKTAAGETDADEMVFPGTGLAAGEILKRIAGAEPLSFRSVGNTSIVLKVDLEGEIDAAFKPAWRRRPGGWLLEVAAYRLARLLGLETVPPVVTRRISRQELKGGLELGRDRGGLWRDYEQELLWEEDGRVPGAAILWVQGMRDLGLERRRGALGMQTWSAWLRVDGEPVPEEARALAADLSNMLAFDYLIGNPDRFSGGNMKGDEKGARLYIRDHDLALPRRLSDRAHGRVLRRLLQAERFSRGFYRRLRGLERERLEKELALDPAAAKGPILDEHQLNGLFDRREALLSHISSLVALHGEERVLAFP